jgi:putative Holliday junction resolvase
VIGGDRTRVRILALDLGSKRIGMALSDELGITAQGLETLHRTNERKDLARLARLVEERDVRLVLVGNPLQLGGQAGPRSEWARRFAEKLRARAGCEVMLRDERLTTVEAKRALGETGPRRRHRAGDVDRMAAVLLLREYLDLLPAGDGMDDPRP